jgi:hypothetical protein
LWLIGGIVDRIGHFLIRMGLSKWESSAETVF